MLHNDGKALDRSLRLLIVTGCHFGSDQKWIGSRWGEEERSKEKIEAACSPALASSSTYWAIHCLGAIAQICSDGVCASGPADLGCGPDA